ncbi:MAG TPA: inositol monophosphatase, partial [Thermomicrobiales bacterium]|nr:inositol monophosphatase [Thermomicrobiales bacterium]
VSIAVVHQGVGEIGVVFDPSRDELFAARRGGRATLNGRPIQVSTVDVMSRSLIGTGFSYEQQQQVEQHEIWRHLQGKCQGIRRDGSAALGVAWVAAGRTDGFYERPINAWDVGAGSIIVQAAGGAVSAIDGSPYDVFGQELAASNGLIHAELIDEIGAAISNVGTPVV